MNSSVQLTCHNLHLTGAQHSGGSRGGTWGGRTPLPPSYFYTKVRPEELKKFLGATATPPALPPLSQGLDPALQHETNNKTLYHEHSKSFPTYTSQINPVGFFPQKLFKKIHKTYLCFGFSNMSFLKQELAI